MKGNLGVCALAILAGLVGMSILSAAVPAVGREQNQPPETFSAADTSNGENLYQQRCASCHGTTFAGGAGGPPLGGAQFRARYPSHQALFDYVRAKMPPGSEGTLGDMAYTNIAAYLLKAGATTAKVRIPRPTIDQTVVLPDSIAVAAKARQERFLAAITPITDEMLRRPPVGDWLNWRGTYDAHGYSPLTQINRDNVASLKPAWAWQLGPSVNEVNPIVHDGVLFVASGGRLEALEAATGDLLWRYVRSGNSGILRNLAIYGDLVYLAAETNIVALNVHSGAVVWDTQYAPSDAGIRFGSGPIAAKGKLYQGMGNCYAPYPGGCFLLGIDAATGTEVWRFSTIAWPGQPGGDTWNGVPKEERQGSSIWVAGSYDPELDLIYFGTGQTYKTAPLISPKGRAAGLYTDTTLALRPDTGELVWHYQHTAGDVWDLDWAFERTLATIKVDGATRRTVTTAGKMGIFDTLDAATGKYLYSIDVGLQTLVQSIDPRTGVKKVRPEFEPQANVAKSLCPGTQGARNWPATAYNPVSGALFVPLNETCMDFIWSPGGDWDWNRRLKPRAGSDGMVGRVQAIDLATGKTLWTNRRRAPQISAILATAGGLVFEGSRDRWFRALDDRTGNVLWQTRLEAAPSSFPITYSVNGVQYVAVAAGGGNALDATTGILTPEIVSPSGAVSLQVFRLFPDASDAAALGRDHDARSPSTGHRPPAAQ